MRLWCFGEYSVVTKKCQAQLADDFGVFPPSPLLIKTDNLMVNIVTMSGLGELFYCLAARVRLLRALRDHPSTVSQGLNPFPANAFGMLLQLLISPYMVWLLYKLLRKKKKGAAVFLPMHSRDNYILLRPKVSERTCLAALVSHEHLHLLQNRNAPNTFVLNAHTVLPEKWATDADALYLLGRVEMEARLHELVLSYYRSSGRLPVTVQEFLALLCGCEMPGLAVIEALQEYAAQPMTIVPYEVRDARFAEDVDNVLRAMSTLHLRFRFVIEVLPVMYSNLLQYYGDGIHSATIRAEIARPNLYDDLYVASGTQLALAVDF